MPSLFDIEVTAALIRRGVAPRSVGRFFRRHLVGRAVVPVGRKAARLVNHVVAVTRLRAADALYVWLAAREGLALVTCDREILERAALVGADAVAP